MDWFSPPKNSQVPHPSAPSHTTFQFIALEIKKIIWLLCLCPEVTPKLSLRSSGACPGLARGKGHREGIPGRRNHIAQAGRHGV